MVQKLKFREKYDTVITGIISGILLPLAVGIVIYLFSANGKTIGEYFSRINEARIVTHAITICVFPNLAIFFIFNRLDMLKAVRGVLAITIVWAFAVFIIKFT